MEDYMSFANDLRYLIDQEKVDDYYIKKKREVGQWLALYAENLKRIKQDQKERIMLYANSMSFSTAGEANAYVQELDTVSKRDKEKLEKYLQEVDWLPEGETMGYLDGVMVSRVLKSPLEKLLGDKEWKSKKE